MEEGPQAEMEKTNSSVDRSLAILELLSQRGQPVGAIDIGRMLKINKATVYSLLHTLEVNQYVIKSSTGKYQLTSKLYSLGITYYHTSPLVLTLNNCVTFLEKKHPCVVCLATYGPAQCGMILALKGRNPNQSGIMVSPGTPFPLHATSLGKVILAFSPSNVLTEYTEKSTLYKYTEATISSKEKLLADIRQVVQRGYAIDDGEQQYSLCCIGAPVYGPDKEFLAAVSLSGQQSYMAQHRKEVIQDILLLARNMSRLLGYSPDNSISAL